MVYRRNRDLEARNQAKLMQQQAAQQQPNSVSPPAAIYAPSTPSSALANGVAEAGERPAAAAAGTKATVAIPHTYAAKAQSQPQTNGFSLACIMHTYTHRRENDMHERMRAAPVVHRCRS
eukprot:scaffold44137_cov14-Tisochrysis_lutea.AAC.1